MRNHENEQRKAEVMELYHENQRLRARHSDDMSALKAKMRDIKKKNKGLEKENKILHGIIKHKM